MADAVLINPVDQSEIRTYDDCERATLADYAAEFGEPLNCYLVEMAKSVAWIRWEAHQALLKTLHRWELGAMIEVPEGLDAEAAAEFIRNVIIARGGNPDTAYVVSIGENFPRSQTLSPRTFQVEWS